MVRLSHREQEDADTDAPGDMQADMAAENRVVYRKIRTEDHDRENGMRIQEDIKELRKCPLLIWQRRIVRKR